MTKILAILSLLFFLTSCSTLSSWDKTDKTLLVASTVAVTADAYTTMRGLSQPGIYEANPVHGRHPSDARIIATMVASHAIILYIAHKFPKLRKILLGSNFVVNAGFALHNQNLRK